MLVNLSDTDVVIIRQALDAQVRKYLVWEHTPDHPNKDKAAGRRLAASKVLELFE